MKKKKLGEMLIRAGLITEAQLLNGLERQKNWGGRLGSNLVMTGAIKESVLLKFLSAQTGFREVNLTEMEISPKILSQVPQKVVEKFNLIPIRMRDKNTLIVALADPTDLNAIDQVAFITGHHIEPVITSYSAILHAINKYYLANSFVNSSNKEIVIGEDLNPAFTGISEQDDMENHGGRAALADPDLILFGDQSESEIPMPHAASGLDPIPDSQPKLEEEPSLNSDLLELGQSFQPPAAARPSTPVRKVPSNSNLGSFSMEQRLVGMYHLLLKKRLISEAELAEELMKLWSMGKL
ncbi:MAG: hypothetical protein CSB47_03175 [Proteobacteria bacterium]|nr:MAG: hypothetical protein CSB47_03175 [Pseudomonadota bacterium]